MVKLVYLDEEKFILPLSPGILAEVLESPEQYKGCAFICHGGYFLQYPPYFNSFSTRVAKLLSVRKHLDLSIIFITNKAHRIRDKAVLNYLEAEG